VLTNLGVMLLGFDDNSNVVVLGLNNHQSE
jgi:hypothetical protein